MNKAKEKVMEVYKKVGMSPRQIDKLAIAIAIKEAKKEVFDDIDKLTSVGVPLFHDDCNCEWCMIKKKHLNTSNTEKLKEGENGD